MKISKEDAKAFLDRHQELLKEMLEYQKTSTQKNDEDPEEGPDLIRMYHTLKTYELEKKLNLLRKPNNNPAG